MSSTYMERYIQLTDSSFGGHDCFINAVDYWLKINQYSPSQVYYFNWDYYCLKDSGIFGGSVSKETLLKFLLDYYGIASEQVAIADLFESTILIMAFDTYYLPYIKEYHGRVHHIHYAPVCIEGQTAAIHDPFYRILYPVETKDLDLLAGAYKGKAILFRYLGEQRREDIIKPYLSQKSFQQAYHDTTCFLKGYIRNLVTYKGDLAKNDDYRRIYSNIKGVYLARKKHFEASNDPQRHSWKIP